MILVPETVEWPLESPEEREDSSCTTSPSLASAASVALVISPSVSVVTGQVVGDADLEEQ